MASPNRIPVTRKHLKPQKSRKIQEYLVDYANLGGSPLDEARRAALYILFNREVSLEYFILLQKVNPRSEDNIFKEVDIWLQKQGFDTTAEQVQDAIEVLKKDSLAPWTNVYQTNFSGGTQLVIQGSQSEEENVVMWGNENVKHLTFHQGVLTWSTTYGNAENAEITFTSPDDFTLKISGYVWYESQGKPSVPNVSAEAAAIVNPDFSVWNGKYNTQENNGEWVTGKPVLIQAGLKQVDVEYNSVAIKDFKYNKSVLTWEKKSGNKLNSHLLFDREAKNGSTTEIIKGYLWSSGSKPKEGNLKGVIDAYMSNINGSYKTQNNIMGHWQFGPELFIYGTNDPLTSRVLLGGDEIKRDDYKYNSSTMTLEFALNEQKYDLTFYPSKDRTEMLLHGYRWQTSSSKPVTRNVHGSQDKLGSEPWSGHYNTYLYKKSGGQPQGCPSFRFEGTVPSVYGKPKLFIKDKEVSGVAFNDPVMSWKDATNDWNGQVTFYMESGKRVRKMTGKVWNKGAILPIFDNFTGTINENDLYSRIGIYYTKIGSGSKKEVGPKFEIKAGFEKRQVIIYVNEIPLRNPKYDNPTLSWSENDGNASNAKITFYTGKYNPQIGDPPVQKFYGRYWLSGKPQPGQDNFYGTELPDNPTPPSDETNVHANNALSISLSIIAGLLTGPIVWGFNKCKKRYKEWKESQERGDPEEEIELNERRFEESLDNVSVETDTVSEYFDAVSQIANFSPDPGPGPGPTTDTTETETATNETENTNETNETTNEQNNETVENQEVDVTDVTEEFAYSANAGPAGEVLYIFN